MKRQLHKQVRGPTLYKVAALFLLFFFLKKTHINNVTSLTSAGSKQRHGPRVLCAHRAQDLVKAAQRFLGASPEGLSDIRNQPAAIATPVAAAATAGAAAAAAPNTNWNTFTGLSELQCPRCLATFHDRDAAEYLNHCEECAKV